MPAESKENLLDKITSLLSPNTFVKRIVFLLAVLGLFYTTTIVTVFIFSVRSTIINNHIDQSKLENQIVVNEMSYFFETSRDSLVIIERLAQVRNIANAQSQSDSDLRSEVPESVENLENIFHQVLLVTEEYLQMRYIDNTGKEVIRASKNLEGEVSLASGEELVRSVTSDYLNTSARATKGSVIVSSVSLNRFGYSEQIIEPYQPVVMFSTPVFSDNNERVGVLVIDFDATELLHVLPEPDLGTSFIVNSNGDYLNHPQEEKEWGSIRDLNNGENIEKDYPGIYPVILQEGDGSYQSKGEIFVYSKVTPSGNFPDSSFYIVDVILVEEILAPINDLLTYIVGGVSLLLLLMIGTTSTVVSYFLKPLKQLTTAAKRVSKKDFSQRVVGGTDDDMGELVDAFNSMADDLEDLYNNLERKVESQTKQLRKNLSDLEEEQDKTKRLMQAIEASSNLVYIADSDKKIIYVNKVVKDQTGYSSDEVVGSVVGELWGEKMSDKFYKNLWYQVKVLKQTFRGEINGEKKSGSDFIAELTINPVLDEEGRVEYYVVIQREVTLERKLEKLRSEFVTLVSHQFRTPLGNMRWLIESLADSSAKMTKASIRSLGELRVINQRLLRLVNDLLFVSELEASQRRFSSSEIDLKDLIERVVKSLEESKVATDVSIKIEFNSVPEQVWQNAVLLQKLIEILLQNAIDYSVEGGEVVIQTDLKEDKFVLTVIDHGVGIPKEEQDKLFEKFFRGESSKKRYTERTGLGLYLSRLILDVMKGKISFTSEEGKGSTFWVEIPVGSKPEEDEQETSDGQKEKIESESIKPEGLKTQDEK